MYKNENWIEYYWLDSDEEVARCEDCPHPSGCIRECVIKTYTQENVAKIRDEEEIQ